MDSLPGEDPTLPLEFNGSVNISRLPDVSGDEIHAHLGALPDVAEDAVSPTRVRTMKDFENQITELRKENFNLKLRIYFLEERIQQKFDGPNEDVYRINIELKVELESLKRELQEREQLLVKASKAVESLAQGGDVEIQRLKEEARRQVNRVEESLTNRIHLLEEELKSVQRELEEAFAVTERERALRLAAEQQLCLSPSMQSKDLDVMAALEEKDRHIEQLSLTLQSKEAVIQLLEKAKSRSGSPEGALSAEKTHDDTTSLLHEKERELEALRTELRNGKNDFEKRIQALQEELLEQEKELSAEKRNALKRDKTIQGLTLALKTKETENEEFSSEIEKLNASLAKAREATHKVQMQKFKGAEDYQALLAEKENLLIELRSENLYKDTENRKLQRKIKRADQELKDLHFERDKWMKELDEVQLQKSRSDKTIHDLRNQLEKMHSETDEREKAAERHYRVLLSESNQKLQSQELVIAHLTDGMTQKDQLVQQLEGTIREKDAELQEWLVKFQGVLKEKDALERRNEDSVEEKGTAQSLRPAIDAIRELEKTKESECAELTEALRRERDAFSRLLKTLEDADGINMNNLREEVNNIFLLRKQLEEDISTNWNLRKVLEDQIKANRKEEESISSWGDQTSYMSIFLGEQDHLSLQVDHLSLEELKKKVLELLCVVKELHSVNQDLRQKHLESSKLESLAKESLTALDQNELLERTEESVTLTEGFDEETSASSGQPLESSSKQVIPSDSLDRQCKTPDEPRSGGSTPGPSCAAQEKSLLVSLSNASIAALESSREEEMKTVDQPFDRPPAAEREGPSDDLEHKDEKELKQLILQLRDELRHLAEGNRFLKQQGGEWQVSLAENETSLDPDPALQMNAGTDAFQVDVRDTATQTVMVEGGATREKHRGQVGTSEEKGQDLRFPEDWERQQDRALPTSEQQEAVLRTSRTNKSDSACPFKKSRLPVPLKPSKSLGSVLLSTRTQKPDMHLQHRIFTLDEDLKGKPVQRQLLSDDSQLSKTESGTPAQDAESGGADEPSIKMDCTEGDVSVVSSDTKDGMSKEQSNSRETECEATLSALETLNEDFDSLSKQDIDSATTYSGSKSLLSLKLSITSTEAFDSEMVDDVEELRRKIRDLKAELAKCRANQAPPPAQPFPPSDALATAQDSGVLPADGSFVSMLDANRLETAASSDARQQAEYQLCAENAASYVSERHNEETVEKLKELLSENEAELEKEQIANMHLLDEVCRLQSKLQGTSLSRSNSPILTPMHEQSWQRQKIQESHSICVTYRQHLTNLIKAFEELLQASELDYYVAEGFREQLNQSVQLFERLEKQCLYGESLDDEITQLCGLVRSVTSVEMSEKLHTLEPPKQREGGAEEGERERLTAMLAKFPPELLMEHLQEIRMLRHQLEESIQTNNRLRKQLEQQVAGPAQDPGSANVCIHSSEQHNSLTSEIHFLRKQNQALNVMLAKGSRDKQKENEKLRESLSRKHLAAEQLRKDCEHIQAENEKLQKQVGKRDEENGHLTHEVYSVRNQLNRLQVELTAKQHQLLENDKLLHSLRLELKVYEKLDETLGSQKDRSRGGSEECWKDKNHPLDLHDLLTEIQKLRGQLERSIKANKSLHEKVEEQLSREKGSSGSAVNINYLFQRESQHRINEFKFPSADGNILELHQKHGCCTLPLKGDAELALDGTDVSSRCSSPASKSRDPCAIPGHCVWADKNGRHILGSVEDYNCLRKQISEGRKLLSALELHLKEIECQESGEKVPHQASLSRLSATVSAIQQNFEEAARLLKLLWRVSLPMKVVHTAAYSLQDEGLKAELHKLRRKLAEQEKKLHSTAKRLHFTSQLKENMEQVIISQLALTHDVLKKARGNLEVQPAENRTAAFSLSEKKVL